MPLSLNHDMSISEPYFSITLFHSPSKDGHKWAQLPGWRISRDERLFACVEHAATRPTRPKNELCHGEEILHLSSQ